MFKVNIKISQQHPKMIHVNEYNNVFIIMFFPKTFGKDVTFSQKDLDLVIFAEFLWGDCIALCLLLILSTENGKKRSKFLKLIVILRTWTVKRRLNAVFLVSWFPKPNGFFQRSVNPQTDNYFNKSIQLIFSQVWSFLFRALRLTGDWYFF